MRAAIEYEDKVRWRSMPVHERLMHLARVIEAAGKLPRIASDNLPMKPTAKLK